MKSIFRKENWRYWLLAFFIIFCDVTFSYADELKDTEVNTAALPINLTKAIVEKNHLAGHMITVNPRPPMDDLEQFSNPEIFTSFQVPEINKPVRWQKNNIIVAVHEHPLWFSGKISSDNLQREAENYQYMLIQIFNLNC